MSPASDSTPPPVPVTLLSGFLGAGKTTLVNRILTERHGERIAVVVNEFGDVPIDGRLVVGADEEVVELSNGCVCCTVRGDLVRTIGELLARRRRRLFKSKPFERLLIEGSGLASPGPVVQTLEIEPDLAERTRFDGVVTLAHCGRILDQLEKHPEASEQIGYADVILLNHRDRATEAELEAVQGALGDLNPMAELLRTENAAVDVGRLFGRRKGPWRGPAVESSHGHTQGARTLVLKSEAPLDLHRLKMWIQFTASRRSHELWRIKGIVRCTDRREPVVVQGVYQWLELGGGDGEPPAESVVVLIGRDLDDGELERGWRLCQDAAQEPDEPPESGSGQAAVPRERS